MKRYYIANIKTKEEGTFSSYPTDNKYVAKMDGERMRKEFREMKVEVESVDVVTAKPITVSREGRIF
jgi:environmental stress-induced protein Ves